MTIRIGAFIYRKKGLTTQEFQDYYENKHIPLLLEIFGPLFPKVHRRHYPVKDEANNTNALIGQDGVFDFDAFVEGEYDDEEHAKKFQDKFWQEHERIAADESEFQDQTRLGIAAFQPLKETRRPKAR